MIPTEIITFTVSTGILLRQGFAAQVGAWIKLKSKQMEVQRHQADLLLRQGFGAQVWAKQAGVVLEDRQKARHFIPPGGPLTRRIIVLAVLFTVFIAPFILAAFFPHTPVFYAYAEKTRGFWFIFESLDKMRFEQMSGYVILPVHTQMAAAISGFYFGGGLAK